MFSVLKIFHFPLYFKIDLVYAKSPQYSRHSLVSHANLEKKKDSPSYHSSMNKREKAGVIEKVISHFYQSIFIEDVIKTKENNLKKSNPSKQEKVKKYLKKIGNNNSKTKKAFRKLTQKSISSLSVQTKKHRTPTKASSGSGLLKLTSQSAQKKTTSKASKLSIITVTSSRSMSCQPCFFGSTCQLCTH